MKKFEINFNFNPSLKVKMKGVQIVVYGKIFETVDIMFIIIIIFWVCKGWLLCQDERLLLEVVATAVTSGQQ